MQHEELEGIVLHYDPVAPLAEDEWLNVITGVDVS